MKGDFTRFTFRPSKHYAGVLQQQGRVQLDADWNEQFEIQDHRWKVQTVDTIGSCGAPKHAAGFEVSLAPGGQDLVISPGRIYVDGLLCELETPEAATEILYSDQPDYPAPLPPAIDPGTGRTDLVYLDVWRRHLTATEDP